MILYTLKPVLLRVVPESCQRTDGIDAWLDIKEAKQSKRMEKEEKQRERQESLNGKSSFKLNQINTESFE